MCGLAGSFTPGKSRPLAELQAEAQRMSRAVAHRGPDSSGTWFSEGDGLAFAHRRLEIFGPGAGGAQPMVSTSGRFTLIFNGAIYNYIELRDVLRGKGALFRGDSDTEVLLAAIEQAGLEQALDSAMGMFALALWDNERKILSLARDRLGEKPLYYSWDSGRLCFGSELGVFDTVQLDEAAVDSFLSFGFSTGFESVLSGVNALPPGVLLECDARGGNLKTRRYWYARPRVVDTELSMESTVDELKNRLRDAVRFQLRADVPIGIFLSGGIDSTLVASVAREQTDASLPAFSVGFEDERFNELTAASETAKRLGFEHHSFVLDQNSILNEVTDWFDVISEPIADPSIVPTRALTRFARDHVTTVITGDGGDELFGGYERYLSGAALWSLSRRVPDMLMRFGVKGARALPPAFFSALGAVAGGRNSVEEPARRFDKALGALIAKDYSALQRALVAKMSLSGEETSRGDIANSREELIGRLMDDDLRSYLPGSVLTKLDRCAMSVGLETRAPFLDHHLVQWSRTLPVNLLVDGAVGKRPVRELLAQYGDKSVAKGVKRGFSPPLDAWLRGPLNEFWRDSLSGSALDAWPERSRERVKRLLSTTSKSVNRNEYAIWHALTIAAWHKRHEKLARV